MSGIWQWGGEDKARGPGSGRCWEIGTEQA